MAIFIPPELLDIILGHLDEIGPLLACTKTCRRWYQSTIGARYRVDSIAGGCYALFNALNKDNRHTLDRILHLHLHDGYSYPFNYNHLSLAIIRGYTDIAEIMLQSPTLIKQWQSQIYGMDEYGRTPLVAAVLTRNIHLVRLILGIHTIERTRLFSYDSLDINAIIAACMDSAIDRGRIIQDYRDNRRRVLKPRLKWPVIEEKQQQQQAPRDINISNMDDLVNLLINAGASINCKAWSYTSPLHCAVKYNNQDFIQFLLDRGANINLKIDRGYTPLAVAIRMRSMTMIKLLISHGADWTITTQTGADPLHLTDNIEIAQYFIDLGVRINPPRSFQHGYWSPLPKTPLMSACESGYSEMANFLLQQGADPFASNSSQHTTLYAAASSSSRDMADVVEILYRRGVSIERSTVKLLSGPPFPYGSKKPPSPLQRAASLGHVATVEKLLQFGARPERNPEKPGILCFVDTEEIVPLLMQYGVDLDEASKTGDTASHYLAGHKFKQKHARILKVYSRLGANLNLWNEAGDTALHIAVTNQNHDAIKGLIEAAADPDRPNRSGLTPLISAPHKSTPSTKHSKQINQFSEFRHSTQSNKIFRDLIRFD